MKTYLATAILLGAWMPGAAAQEDELTPAQALELLEDAERDMDFAERLLQEESVEKAEKREKGAVDKLGEVIRKARSSAGRSSPPPPRRELEAKPSGQKGRSEDSAKRTYDPNRADAPSKFKSAAVGSGTWGQLPPAARAAMLSASKEEVPPEFQEIWKKYYENLEKSGQ